MAGRLEVWLSRTDTDARFLGDAAGAVADDLTDASDLSDLFESLADGPDLADEAELLRASRLPRLRPVLVALAARAAGGSAVDPELQYAAELLHAALAVHDLALGASEGRRHRLARSVLKRGVSWLGGNQMLLRAMELVRHAPSPEVLDELLEALRAFSESQALAGELMRSGHPTVALWDEHADGHTGALFAFCCRAGAHVAGASHGDVSALGRYGSHLGRMWHIAEDICLLAGDDAADHLLGRALIGRPVLPVAIAIERDPAAAELWRRLTDAPSLEHAEALIDTIRRVRGLVGTREVLLREHWQARQALSRLERGGAVHALDRLASGLLKAPYGIVELADAGEEPRCAEG